MTTHRPWHLPTYEGDAFISEDGRYRWQLRRWWDHERPDSLIVIGLNPSTADGKKDDPTIHRCVDFADRLGFGGLVMLNAYAFRATDPADMLREADPIGYDNNLTIKIYLADAKWAVCAWTDHVPPERRDAILRLFAEVDCEPRVWGLTKGGAPRHPLYLKRDAVPVRWAR